MLVRVIEPYVAYLGARGTTKDIPASHAKALIALRKVEAVEQEPVAPPWEEGEEQAVDVTIREPEPQTYLRRDMAAEPIAPAPRRRGRPRTKKVDVPPSTE